MTNSIITHTQKHTVHSTDQSLLNDNGIHIHDDLWRDFWICETRNGTTSGPTPWQIICDDDDIHDEAQCL